MVASRPPPQKEVNIYSTEICEVKKGAINVCLGAGYFLVYGRLLKSDGNLFLSFIVRPENVLGFFN